MENNHHSGNVRRFRLELVESTSRSSKEQETQHSDKCITSHGSSLSTPADPPASIVNNKGQDEERNTASVGTGKPRRFLAQPTETTSRSSKKTVGSQNTDNQSKINSNNSQNPLTGDSEGLDSKKKRVRPLPQPVEVTKKTNNKGSSQNKTGSEGNGDSNKSKHRRKFQIEPFETVKVSRRQRNKTDEERSNSTSTDQSTLRKFPPQLIETGKRSHRRSETLPPQGSSKDYDESINSPLRPSSPPISRGQQITAASTPSSLPSESRFSYASLLQRQEGRRHSFRVPDLPAIPSNSSEASDDSDFPSPSTTPSGSERSATKFAAETRSRESCDERFSGYLLSLAARSAENQLRDQALAAFPNEQVHQPVSHFIDGDEEFGNEDDPVGGVSRINKRIDPMFRRASTIDLSWELEQMRRHKEEAETTKNLGVHKSDAHESRFSAAAIASRQPDEPSSLFTDWQRDLGLAKMRHAASPPMLGDDIVFVLSASPQGTASENDPVVVNQTEPEPAGNTNITGLWINHLHSEDSDKPGLWMGFCHKEEGDEEISHFHRAKTGIATPRPDRSYFDTLRDLNIEDVLSDSDSESSDNNISSDIKICVDPMDIDTEEKNYEFNDAFVTQVYNYLSLGYPSLARYYDHELSKISGIPIADLRQDDLHTEAKGHVVGVSSTTNNDDDKPIAASSPIPEKCMRWKALQLYIREWARQQPTSGILFNDDYLDAWGVIERRGSWAV